jgi:anaerobic ribonucleoside-triphosphate reductase activating protein
LAGKLARSASNGPGTRAVIWVQGCSLDCPACYNPGLRPLHDGEEVSTTELASWAQSLSGIEGISISGGEPTDQLPGILELLDNLRGCRSGLSVLLFSGRSLEQILDLEDGKRLIAGLDVLVDGPYDHLKANPAGVWPSSSNQRIHLLTGRYQMADFKSIPEAEVQIAPDGTVCMTGLGGFTILTDRSQTVTPFT